MLLYSGTIHVGYGQIDITGDSTLPDLGQSRADRGDELLGRFCDSGAILFTASRDGELPIEVYVWEHEPDAASDWERQAARVLYFPEARFALSSFEGGFFLGLPHEGRYNVRCGTRGYDHAVLISQGRSPDWPDDRYRLDLWPALTDEVSRPLSTP